MSATLGGLIKDYRLQKNLSQMEVAFALGWNETSRLSRIEQGRVSNPSREFIDKLIDVLKLDEEERNHLLLVGNYLPEKDEIEKIKKEVSPLIHKWLYPAVIYDFSWRIIEVNQVRIDIYQINADFNQQLLTQSIYILDVIFSPDFIMNKNLKGEERRQRKFFLVKTLAQYQYQQRTRTKEAWYISLIKRLMNNSLFREVWQESLHLKEKDIIGNSGYKSVINPKNSDQRLNFYFFIEAVIKDPRFFVDLYIPTDLETFKYFK